MPTTPEGIAAGIAEAARFISQEADSERARLDQCGIDHFPSQACYRSAALGTILGPAVAADKVVEAVDALVATYLDARGEGERFVDTYRRIGAQPFKDRVYATV